MKISEFKALCKKHNAKLTLDKTDNIYKLTLSNGKSSVTNRQSLIKNSTHEPFGVLLDKLAMAGVQEVASLRLEYLETKRNKGIFG